jgi:hypothetical protein
MVFKLTEMAVLAAEIRDYARREQRGWIRHRLAETGVTSHGVATSGCRR